MYFTQMFPVRWQQGLRALTRPFSAGCTHTGSCWNGYTQVTQVAHTGSCWNIYARAARVARVAHTGRCWNRIKLVVVRDVIHGGHHHLLVHHFRQHLGYRLGAVRVAMVTTRTTLRHSLDGPWCGRPIVRSHFVQCCLLRTCERMRGHSRHTRARNGRSAVARGRGNVESAGCSDTRYAQRKEKWTTNLVILAPTSTARKEGHSTAPVTWTRASTTR